MVVHTCKPHMQYSEGGECRIPGHPGMCSMWGEKKLQCGSQTQLSHLLPGKDFKPNYPSLQGIFLEV